MHRLKVSIDGRIIPGSHGGVESVVQGLAEGLSAVDADDVDVTFVAYSGYSDWLDERAGALLHVRGVPLPGHYRDLTRKCRPWAIRRAEGSFSLQPRRDRSMESTQPDVVHFPLQGPGWVSQPYIYHPHDLQHRHLPEFFTKHQRASRDVVYGAHLRRAAAVAVGTTWVKNDLTRQMNVDPAKIFVVPLAPLKSEQVGPESWVGKPSRYLIYPAADWPHKNHKGLFAALRILADEGLDVQVVLTGSRQHRVDLADLAKFYSVAHLVCDVGYVDQHTLESLISGARGTIVPTLFEAASFPVWESFRLGSPVACSNVTSLPMQVGDAAFLFDPTSDKQIAEALRLLWERPPRVVANIERGRARVAAFTWEKTARHFLALYRLLGGRKLQASDRRILDGTPSL